MKAPRISEGEWQVMKSMWKLAPGPCLAQDIMESLAQKNGWSQATIKTLINRLVQKKALKFKKVGKSYQYSPAFTEKEFQQAETDSFLNRVFDGALSPLIAHFAHTRPLTTEEIDSLEQLLRDQRKNP
jgi:BlaI family transcriptional regulator, penicillinase repressor